MLIGIRDLQNKTCKLYICSECLYIHYADGIQSFEVSIEDYSLPHDKITTYRWTKGAEKIVNILNRSRSCKK